MKRTVPISIDYPALMDREFKANRLPMARMLEIMEGCVKGLESLPEKTLDLVVAVKIRPISPPDGFWPKPPREPVDYDIKVVLTEVQPGERVPDNQTIPVRSALCSTASDADDLPLVDRIAKEISDMIIEQISFQANVLRARSEYWKQSLPKGTAA